MTKRGKIICILLIIVAILLKEEIYGFLFKTTITSTIEKNVCTIENETIKANYQELLNAYQYNDLIDYHLSHTKVLFRNVYNLDSHITIYKGWNAGLQEKNLVMNEQGLVGVISEVKKNSSEVELLLNSNLNLSVKIKENYGILKYENNTLIVKGINNKGNVEVGDLIYTSDISIYPENVLIGKVEEVENDTYEIEKVVKVIPAVDFENLKYVSVITNLRGQE